MNGLNNNGRPFIDQKDFDECDEPGKILAFNTLTRIFKQPNYELIIPDETYQYGDLHLNNLFKKTQELVEVECREPWQHKDNMLGRFADVNFPLKHKVQELKTAGVKGFSISLSKADLGKSFATEFYIIKLSDLDLNYIGPAPNRRHKNEWVYKLLNHQVVKWKYDYILEEYIRQNEYKPRFYKKESHDDYYN
jgi:hypothetical protein